MSNRKAFIHALAEFLGGTNQCEMSISLGDPCSSNHRQAEMWSNIRQTTPLFGYPTLEKTERTLTDFLYGNDVELK